MNCQDREPDLLLYGLGELPPRERRQMAQHLRSCPRCRARQQELAAVSSQIAAALRPPIEGLDRPEGPGTLQPPLRPRYALAPFVLALVLTLLTLSMVGVWYFRAHHPAQQVTPDAGCQPDLVSDKCK